jgi:predicted DNA-binding transcriptional regulator AlpA
MASITNKSSNETLPIDGMSRWSQFKKFLPISREKFRQLSKEGRAPKPIRLGIRCTFYSNNELHRFFHDPLNYRSE